MHYLIKILISAMIIVISSEVAKCNAIIGGLIKSLPLVFLLAILWLYISTQDPKKIAALSYSTFWFVLPTLPMFLVLPYLLHQGIHFYISFMIAIIVMLMGYVMTFFILKRLGMMS